MPKVGPGLGAILSAAELPAAVVVSVLVLQEQVSVLRWLGIIIVMLGIAIPQLAMTSRSIKLSPADHANQSQLQ